MYERKKPLIEIDGFTIEGVEDIQHDGVLLTQRLVVEGRTKTSKVWVRAEDIHKTLIKALGLKFENELKTPEQWCRELGARILDADGWRGDPNRSWHDPISRQEFDRRLNRCTVDSTGYPTYYDPAGIRRA